MKKVNRIMSNKTDGGKLLSDGNAYIMFLGIIDAQSAQALAECISNLPKDTHTLHISFSTEGGSVTYGFAIYHFLRGLPYEIIMHNIGSVDSIGLTIFLAGEKRYTTTHGTFLIHRVTSDQQKEKVGASLLKETLNSIEANEQKVRNLYRERSSMPKTDIDKLFESGELKDAKYALDHGIAHEIREFTIPANTKILIVKADSNAS